MRVVFLDIDGVLNRIGADYSGFDHPLDAAAIARLNRIAHETSAVAVLTSSWRLMLPWPECKDALVAFGVEMEIVGETADLWAASQDLDEARRGEIEAWLRDHEVDAYAVLDDHPVYPEGEAHFVRTLDTQGLSDEDVARVIELLR